MPLPKRKSEFSLYNMLDEVRACTASLKKALDKQGVGVAEDVLFKGISGMLEGLSGGKISPDNDSVIASNRFALANGQDAPRPEYSVEADFIICATALHKEGNVKAARELIEAAFSSDGMPNLVAALQYMNSQTDIAAIAAMDEGDMFEDMPSDGMSADQDDSSSEEEEEVESLSDEGMFNEMPAEDEDENNEELPDEVAIEESSPAYSKQVAAAINSLSGSYKKAQNKLGQRIAPAQVAVALSSLGGTVKDRQQAIIIAKKTASLRKKQ